MRFNSFHKILFLGLFLIRTYSSISQDLNKIAKWNKEISVEGVHDTTRISNYIKIALEYRANIKDSALKYIGKAVKISSAIGDVNRNAEALYTKATIYYFSGDFKTAKSIMLLSLNQSKKANNKYLISKNYNVLGAIEFEFGNYLLAEKYYNKKLKISLELKDTSSIIESYYNISLIFSQIADYKRAIDYNYKSYQLSEKFGDSKERVYATQGMAHSYYKIKDYENAFRYLKKAKELAIATNDQYALAGIFIDFGNIYQGQKHWEESIKHYDRALSITIKTENKFHQAVAANNKALSLMSLKKFDEAISLLIEAEKIDLKIDRKYGLMQGYNVRAQCYLELNKFNEALEFANKASIIAKNINAVEELASVYEVLFRIYESKKNADSALFYFKKLSDLKDTLNSASKMREISRQELNFEREKSSQIQANEKLLSNARLQKQTQLRNIFIIFSFAILVVLLFLFKNYRQKKKANFAINEQNKVIEHKNKDIMDSINYSKRIQSAILTPDSEIKKYLPQSFVLFIPKDIVSGDFYFIEPVQTYDDNKWIAVAMADCTGHGVPGAFMSIMGYNFLKQSLKEKSIHGPAQSLDFVNKELNSFLRLDKFDNVIRDGMDIAFCAINTTKNILTFAGANNPLWIISTNKNLKDLEGNDLLKINEDDSNYLYEIKANKQHVGFNEKIVPYQLHQIQLTSYETVFMFTDGFPDQFGGEKGKKIKHSQFAKILLKNANLPMQAQHDSLANFLNEWKGNLEQVDDISVLAFKV